MLDIKALKLKANEGYYYYFNYINFIIYSIGDSLLEILNVLVSESKMIPIIVIIKLH